jgi:hypothetical protein
MHVDLAEFSRRAGRHDAGDIRIVWFALDKHGVTDEVSVNLGDEERTRAVGEVAGERVVAEVPGDVRRLRLVGRVRRAGERKGEGSKTGERRGIRVARPSDAERVVQC